jgi:hypothetical protein
MKCNNGKEELSVPYKYSIELKNTGDYDQVILGAA